MIQEVYIKNYRSIAEARVRLSPFTLLIGANGTGKSNFLGLFSLIGNLSYNLEHDIIRFAGPNGIWSLDPRYMPKHFNYLTEDAEVRFSLDHGGEISISEQGEIFRMTGYFPSEDTVQMFSIDPQRIGLPEEIEPKPSVQNDGSGAVQVIDALKNGDREDLFDALEQTLTSYIPEIEKLSSFTPEKGKKQLQVRERHITKPIPVSELSEGTRLVLTLLTILHQEQPPKVICIEDIDHGLHPRLFQRMIEFCFQMTEEKGVQIIATTHNPYLLDHFKDYPETVIIVEKKNGKTIFVPLKDRLHVFEDDDGPLGSLWYGGFVGGVPEQTY